MWGLVLAFILFEAETGATNSILQRMREKYHNAYPVSHTLHEFNNVNSAADNYKEWMHQCLLNEATAPFCKDMKNAVKVMINLANDVSDSVQQLVSSSDDVRLQKGAQATGSRLPVSHKFVHEQSRELVRETLERMKGTMVSLAPMVARDEESRSFLESLLRDQLLRSRCAVSQSGSNSDYQKLPKEGANSVVSSSSQTDSKATQLRNSPSSELSDLIEDMISCQIGRIFDLSDSSPRAKEGSRTKLGPNQSSVYRLQRSDSPPTDEAQMAAGTRHSSDSKSLSSCTQAALQPFIKTEIASCSFAVSADSDSDENERISDLRSHAALDKASVIKKTPSVEDICNLSFTDSIKLFRPNEAIDYSSGSNSDVIEDVTYSPEHSDPYSSDESVRNYGYGPRDRSSNFFSKVSSFGSDLNSMLEKFEDVNIVTVEHLEQYFCTTLQYSKLLVVNLLFFIFLLIKSVISQLLLVLAL